MTTGKRRNRPTAYNETTLSFTGTGGARLDVVVRASDTGAAYRYVLPGTGSVTVRRETSSWTVPTSANGLAGARAQRGPGYLVQTTAGARAGAAPTGSRPCSRSAAIFALRRRDRCGRPVRRRAA